METADTPFGQKKLGRKHIKSFASGIAHMFACSAQHYAWLAYQHRLPTVTIDLLELRIEPAEFEVRRAKEALFPVGAKHSRSLSLRPEATGAVREVTNWLEPLV